MDSQRTVEEICVATSMGSGAQLVATCSGVVAQETLEKLFETFHVSATVLASPQSGLGDVLLS